MTTRSKTGSLPSQSSTASHASKNLTGHKRQHSPTINPTRRKRRRRARNPKKQGLISKNIEIESNSNKKNDIKRKNKETSKEKKARKAKEKLTKQNDFKLSQLRPEIRKDANTLSKEEITAKYCNESDCTSNTDAEETDSDLGAISNNKNKNNELNPIAIETEEKKDVIENETDKNEFVCPLCDKKNTKKY